MSKYFIRTYPALTMYALNPPPSFPSVPLFNFLSSDPVIDTVVLFPFSGLSGEIFSWSRHKEVMMVDFDCVCKLTQPNEDERHSNPEIYNNHGLQAKH
jgi:hypothetical protein